METEEAAPEEVLESGTAPAARASIQSAYQSALEKLGVEGTGQKAEKAEVEAPTDEGTAPAAPVEEPEHIKWVKSIQGDTDDKGQIITEKLAKRAFELNKQAQANAQNLNQLNRILQNPEVAAAIQKAMNPSAATAPAKQEPATEKTDEQVLEEWVMERVNKTLAPVLTQNQQLYQEYANNQMQSAYGKLKEEFGNDESGKPLYDSIADQVGAEISRAAQSSGIAPMALMNELIQRGALYDTLHATASNLLFPQFKARLSAVQKTAEEKALEAKKKTRLTVKGTATGTVKEKPKAIKSILEAARMAEKENPEFADLQ